MSEREVDQLLVERAQGGDQHAFDQLVSKYQRKLGRLLSRFIRDPAEVEDVSQEAFIKAYRALPAFRGESAFYTWLYRIAINTAKNALVSSRRRPVDYDLDLQDPEQYDMQARLKDSETPEGLLLTDEIRDTVNAAIADLPEDLRTAIMLRELEGMSYEEIAAAMDRPGVTLRRRGFEEQDLDGVWWVVAAATVDVNRQVSDAAERRGIFVNAVDDPAHATAYLGGVVRRHGVTFAISTDGRAPALAGLLREALDAWLPEDLDRWLKEADEVRRRWKLDGVPIERRRPQLLETLNRLYAERQNGRKVDEGSGNAQNL